MPLAFRDFVAMHNPDLAEGLPTFDPTNPAEAEDGSNLPFLAGLPSSLTLFPSVE